MHALGILLTRRRGSLNGDLGIASTACYLVVVFVRETSFSYARNVATFPGLTLHPLFVDFTQQVGEAPVGYGYVDLTEGDESYTISGLNPGISYTIYVSALNRHGQGVRAAVATGVTLPLTVPSAPTDVTVETKGYSVTEGDGIGDSQVTAANDLCLLQHNVCCVVNNFKHLMRQR